MISNSKDGYPSNETGYQAGYRTQNGRISEKIPGQIYKLLVGWGLKYDDSYRKKREFKEKWSKTGGKGEIFTVLWGKNIIFEKMGGGQKFHILGNYTPRCTCLREVSDEYFPEFEWMLDSVHVGLQPQAGVFKVLIS